MPQEILLEVAVSSVQRAVAAQRAGAHRLELCEQLEVGGVTPNRKLAREVRAAVHLPVHVLVRPRGGKFVYSPEEFAKMKSEIAEIKTENVQGIVTGVLKSDSSIDLDRTRELVSFAAPLGVAFHRSFDETPNLSEALENVILIGAKCLLTSGGARTAPEGARVLRRLIEQARGRITVLPGGGLHSGNISEVARATGAAELHTGLGGIIRYDDPDAAKFESAVRACLAALSRR